MTSTVEDALAALNEAEATVASNDPLFERWPQVAITTVAVALWAVYLLVTLLWTIWTSASTSEFVCAIPADANGAPPSGCVNGWVATRDQLKDVFNYGLLPFLTLVIGFYFGQKAAGRSDGAP